VYSGKGAFVWIKASPLYDNEGAIVGAIESIRDITEQKQVETILKHDKDAFEKLVEQRSAQLLNVQKELAVSKHLSEIGALAATIAHELRNPLAAIRTAGFNIGRKCRDRKIESHLANIEKKVLESDQIINNLLSYSRIKSPHFETVRILEIIEECIAAAKARFPKWHVAIQTKHHLTRTDTIKADPLQMKELFNNLLNNAFEAFVDKKGKIIISGQLRPIAGLTVSIEDTGVGISAEDLKKISQPFFTTKSKGTGLGLPVCHQLVSLHNGTIHFKSEKGKGTTVTVQLPVFKE
jgi:signal transduction histidine kinase